ncbi:hypothetical protein WA577_003023, partial [Blastocystis sp. JDR]
QALTEEGNAVEEEIRAADGAISKCKAERDVIKQQCINTEKEIQAVIAADSKQMIGSFVNWEKLSMIRDNLQREIQKTTDDIHCLLERMDKIGLRIQKDTEEGRKTQRLSNDMTKARIDEEMNRYRVQRTEFDAQLNRARVTGERLSQALKKEEEEKQSLLAVIQTVKNHIKGELTHNDE